MIGGEDVASATWQQIEAMGGVAHLHVVERVANKFRSAQVSVAFEDAIQVVLMQGALEVVDHKARQPPLQLGAFGGYNAVNINKFVGQDVGQ